MKDFEPLSRSNQRKTQQKKLYDNTRTKQITSWLLIPIVDYVNNLNQHTRTRERKSGWKEGFRERKTLRKMKNFVNENERITKPTNTLSK